MADLVGDHVGLGEVARGTEPPLQFVIEREVDVDLLVERTVEGPGSGARHAAGTLHPAGEEHEGGRRVAAAEVLGEETAPDVFVVGEHDLHHLGHLVIDRLGRRLLLGPRDFGRDLRHHLRVKAQEHHRHHEQQRDQPATHEDRPTDSATILDVFTLPTAFPTHGPCSPIE